MPGKPGVYLPSEGEVHAAGVLRRSEAGAGRGAAPAAMAGVSRMFLPRCLHIITLRMQQAVTYCVRRLSDRGTTSFLKTLIQSFAAAQPNA